MKIAGFLLLLAGWAIVLASLALLATLSAQAMFVVAGGVVEALGFARVVHAHSHKVGA